MGVKISSLPSVNLPYTGFEKIALVQSGVTRSTTLSSLTTYLSGSPISPIRLSTALGQLGGSVIASGNWSFTSTAARPTAAGSPTVQDNSLITRQDALDISWQYTPTILSFSAPTGSVNSGGNAQGVGFDLSLTNTAVSGNFRQASCTRVPSNRPGAGGTALPLANGRCSFIVDIYGGEFRNNEIRMIYGATANELLSSGFAVTFVRNTGQLIIKNTAGTVFTQNFSHGLYYSTNTRYLITWDSGTLKLFEKSWSAGTQSEPKWVQRGSLTATGLPAGTEYSHNAFRIVNYATGATLQGLDFTIYQVAYLGIAATPK